MSLFRKPNPRGRPSPLVEAVTKHPGDWDVVETNDSTGVGRTSNVEHTMWVPLTDDECLDCGNHHNDFVRAHELMHSKLSPETGKATTVKMGKEIIEVSSENIVAAEEYRVNHSIVLVEGEAKLEEEVCPDVINRGIASMMTQGQYGQVIRTAITGGPVFPKAVSDGIQFWIDELYTKQHDLDEVDPKWDQFQAKMELGYSLCDTLDGIAWTASNIMNRGVGSLELPAWDKTRELAAFLEINIKRAEQELPSSGIQIESDDLDTIFQYAEDEDPGGLVQVADDGEGGFEVVPRTDPGDTGSIVWGEEIDYTTADMPLALPPWKQQRHHRAVDEGSIPVNMHRLPVDQRVYRRTKRVAGGSVLIDDSGSMGLDSSSLDAMIEVAPASIVAVYAGEDSYGDSGYTDHHGEIRIVAQKGRRARSQDLDIAAFMGNGIDGPAIEWLGEQPEPRIWVTDGGVTSPAGHSMQRLQKQVKATCKRLKINVVATAEEAADMLQSGHMYR